MIEFLNDRIIEWVVMDKKKGDLKRSPFIKIYFYPNLMCLKSVTVSSLSKVFKYSPTESLLSLTNA
jgi:hypothetical protein